MSTKNNEPGPEALHKAMEHQAEGALDAGAVANATIQTLRQVNVITDPGDRRSGCKRPLQTLAAPDE